MGRTRGRRDDPSCSSDLHQERHDQIGECCRHASNATGLRHAPAGWVAANPSHLNEHRHQRRPAGRVSRNKHYRTVELTTTQQRQRLIGIVEGKMGGVAMYRCVLQFFKKRCAIVAGQISHRSYAALAP